MIEALVTIRDGRPEPANAAEAEAWSELEEGTTYTARLTQAKGKRSLSQLALYMVACEMIADNLPDTDCTKDEVDHLIRIESGHCTPMKLANGTFVRVAKRIAFNKLSPEEFGKFLDKPGGAFDTAARLFGPALADAVRGELDRMIAGEGAGAPNKRARAAA